MCFLLPYWHAYLDIQGNALLRNPYFNKGSAFTKEERDTFKLHGLLPANVQTLEEQVSQSFMLLHTAFSFILRLG